MANDHPAPVTPRSLLLRLRDPADAESWQTFVGTYAPVIYGYCRNRGLQDADAADATQDVLLSVAGSMRTFEYQPERGRFRDWLYTVTRRKIARLLRGRQRTETGTAEAGAELDQIEAPPADTEWTAAFNARVLHVALERVRPLFDAVTWQAFALVWLEHHPAREAAGELGVPIDKVYTAKSRVLKRLREEILLLAADVPHTLP